MHSPDWPRGHRRVFYTAEGGDVLPGRFAIDFVKTSSGGATSCGDRDNPSDAIGYGDAVLAVVDGRVAASRDGVQESPTISGNGAHDPSTAAGNYVVLELGPGLYATYEHLRPGSIRVRQWRTGQARRSDRRTRIQRRFNRAASPSPRLQLEQSSCWRGTAFRRRRIHPAGGLPGHRAVGLPSLAPRTGAADARQASGRKFRGVLPTARA